MKLEEYTTEQLKAELKRRNEILKQEIIYPKFDFDDILAIECCMETAEKVTKDKELYEKLKSIHSRLHDAYHNEKHESMDKAALEPKFKVGDWVIDDEDGCIFQITKVCDNKYEYKGTAGNTYSSSHLALETDTRLWTIEDAKDGDVLISCGVIFIFNSIKENWLYCYCSLHKDGSFIDSPYNLMNYKYFHEVYPATKEERVLLFTKINQSGYEWDDEKKELNRIEHKTDDKVEPKLKIEAGKWYICISQYCNCIEGRCYQSLSDNRIVDDFGTEYDMHNDADKYFRPWTINDAKPGDVLAITMGEWCKIVIFLSLNNEGVEGYGISLKNGELWNTDQNIPYYSKTWTKCLNPATKEQRNLLFTKMNQSGYEWDDEKKELKIIDWGKHIKCNPNSPSVEQESAWSEEDKKMIANIGGYLNSYGNSLKDEGKANAVFKSVDWLISLKGRIHPQSKQEWSEEDEKMLNDAIGAIGAADYYTYDDKQEIENWLKSIKDRI